jgi:hypothetical protein
VKDGLPLRQVCCFSAWFPSFGIAGHNYQPARYHKGWRQRVIMKPPLAGNTSVIVFCEPHSVLVLLAVVECTTDLPLAGQTRHRNHSNTHGHKKVARQVGKQDTVVAET